MAKLPIEFLEDVYGRLPFLVVHVTTDGVVLHCNPETSRVTGFSERELVGKNLWATLFPGKLFAQVPRFISLKRASPLLRDVPMAIRTRDGTQRVIAWSRYVHEARPAVGGTSGAAEGSKSRAIKSFICIGIDLTDRLVDGDRQQLPGIEDRRNQKENSGLMPFGPHIGNAGAIDGEIVQPIAISPPPPGGAGGPGAIGKLYEDMAELDKRMGGLAATFEHGEWQTLTTLAEAVREGQPGMFAFVVRGDRLHVETSKASLESFKVRVEDTMVPNRLDQQ